MDVKETIQLPIKSEFAAFKQYYSQQFGSKVPLLDSTLKYIGGSAGKMMRPMLVLLAAKSAGGVNDTTYAAAAALEMLHTASLLHDDVVDESDMRRGQKSLNAVYSNRIAILTGDYLFSSSLLNAARTRNVEIIEELSLMGRTLSSGEMLQIELQRNGGFNEENYIEVIRCKTASLFACCARFGAVSAGAERKDVEGIARFGELLGICFQIKDDIFDYYDSNIGKPTGSDMREGKITLPALYVLANCSGEMVDNINEKLARGEQLDEGEIAYLIELSKKEGGIEYAERKIEEYRAEALAQLPVDLQQDCLDALTAYLQYVVERSK